ncbi:hypothetical protein BJ508DRAFT_417831, partial [Ascobolus immersus RN42]
MAAFDSSPYGMNMPTRHKGLGEIDLTGMDMMQGDSTRRTASPTPIGHHHPHPHQQQQLPHPPHTPRFGPSQIQHPARHDSHGMPPPSPGFHPGRRNVHSPPPRNMTYPHPPGQHHPHPHPHPHPHHPPQPSRTFPGPGGPPSHPQQQHHQQHHQHQQQQQPYSTSQPPSSFGHDREANIRRVQSIEQGMGLARKQKPQGLVFVPRSEEPDFERIRSPPIRSPTLIASQEMDQHLFVPPRPIPLSDSPTSFTDDDDNESTYSKSGGPYGGYAPHRVASPEVMSRSSPVPSPVPSRPPSHQFPKRKSSLSSNSISNVRPATSHGQQKRQSGLSGMPVNNRHSSNSHRYSGRTSPTGLGNERGIRGKIGTGATAPPLVTLKMPAAFNALARQSIESSNYGSPSSPSTNSLMGKRFIAGSIDDYSHPPQHLATPTSHPLGLDTQKPALSPTTGLPSPPPSTTASPHTSTVPPLDNPRASFRSGISSDNGRSSMAMTDDEFANELSIEDAIGMYQTDSEDEMDSGSRTNSAFGRHLTLEEQRVLLDQEFRSQKMRSEQLMLLREKRESERRGSEAGGEKRTSRRESRAEQLRRESLRRSRRASGLSVETEMVEGQQSGNDEQAGV